jgi:hypothetical protein
MSVGVTQGKHLFSYKELLVARFLSKKREFDTLTNRRKLFYCREARRLLSLIEEYDREYDMLVNS